MDKETRNLIFNTTQAIRRLLEEEFALQLEGAFDVSREGQVAAQPGAQLTPAERLVRQRVVDAIQHRRAGGESDLESVRGFQSEAVFTFVNRLAALKMMEARGLVLPCVSQGDHSQGFCEFSGLAPGLIELPDKGYRLYLECLFDEIGREVGVLFDRTDAASLLWPRRNALESALEKINNPELKNVWSEDETIGWIYQYYNDPEERAAMRDTKRGGSAAPRNSRELAVRNQFFTPRYVVEFLTDNTLGRIWYEMSGGSTSLREKCRYLVRRPNEVFLKPGEMAPQQPKQDGLSQEDLLKQPVFIPHRPLKDPRTILMLDPACGSMHFGLYAFDLFEVIYREAWEFEEKFGADTFICPPGMKSLRESFATKEEFLRQVPRLIIEHNIHGIDIDPRAAQIAGLALWLRAQRAWKTMGLAPAQRPPIRRSNIVCAEPMPGEKELLRDFVTQKFPAAEQPIFQKLLEDVFEQMKLAGEAGSLLKIEEEIRSAIEAAKQLWKAGPKLEQSNLFAESGPAKQKELTIDLSGITDEEFWNTVESRIYAALRTYAEQAESGGGFQRRLFAEDAARGFAFIDVCRKRYDVALMNPPFGEGVPATRAYLLEAYPTGSKEMATCFVEMGADSTGRTGLVGAITSRFMLANDGLIEWRKDEFLDETWNIQSFADLGYGVLDGAMVEACSYIVGSNRGNADRPFINCLDDTEKGEALLTATTSLMAKPDRRVALRALQSFRAVPDYIICYWLPDRLLQAVLRFENIKAQGSAARVGLQTGDNERFARAVWEVGATNIGQGKDWFYFAKGGEYEPFYDDIHLVVLWKDDGYLLKRFVDKNGKLLSRPQNLEFFCREGITYPDRTTSDFSPRIMPSGIIFSSTGFALFPPNQGALLGYLGSAYTRPFKVLVEAFVGSGDSSVSGSAARHYRPGILNLLPNLLSAPEQALQQKIVRSIQTRIRTFETDETSRYFSAFPNLNSSPSIQSSAAVRWLEYVEEVVFLIETNVELEVAVRNVLGIAVDDPVLDELYGLHPAALDGPPPDAQAVLEAQELSEEALIERLVSVDGAGRSTVKKSYFADRRIELVCRIFRISPKSFAAILNGRKVAPKAFTLEFTQSLVSIALGIAFGRWDIRYATGNQAAPELPDPFAPLPVCPPGQLQNAQGLPAQPSDMVADYPVKNIPWDGILVDDPNHPLDIEHRVREVIEIIWKDRAEAIEQEACEILGVNALCDYFRKPAGFFADHLSRYSKSRRQAPIYWPLCSPNTRYTVWLYYHRLNADTLFTVLRDHVKPKLEFEERRAFEIRQDAGPSPSASQRRDIAEAEELVEDLRAFKAELEKVAPLFRPNLNDGVIINYAPLWRLVGLPKWRKDCQSVWNELAQGDYDWAHLALHLWPERVIPKCATDRSLAIAHGLDEVFWQEDPKAPGKSLAVKVPAAKLDQLIAERTSPAVKAALESLLSAGSGISSAGKKTKAAKTKKTKEIELL